MDVPTQADIVAQIDAFLDRHPAVTETRLGRDAVGEASLVSGIRKGRDVRISTLKKLAEYMRERDEVAASAAASSSAEAA